jgi:hypothetical protein
MSRLQIIVSTEIAPFQYGAASSIQSAILNAIGFGSFGDICIIRQFLFWFLLVRKILNNSFTGDIEMWVILTYHFFDKPPHKEAWRGEVWRSRWPKATLNCQRSLVVKQMRSR